MTPIQLADLAHQLADRACIADIETQAQRCPRVGAVQWYDVRNMLDPREQPDDFVEMARQALAYAEARGIILRNSSDPHLVRIMRDVR